jgi:hypothetical protein
LSDIDGKLGQKKTRNFFDKRQETVTRTFHIRAEWDDVVRKEAERQGISVNVLVNLISARSFLSQITGTW